jgi:hypothetical protein
MWLIRQVGRIFADHEKWIAAEPAEAIAEGLGY